MRLGNEYGSTYPTQTNGQTELFNRTVLTMLRCYTRENQRDWDELLIYVVYA